MRRWWCQEEGGRHGPEVSCRHLRGSYTASPSNLSLTGDSMQWCSSTFVNTPTTMFSVTSPQRSPFLWASIPTQCTCLCLPSLLLRDCHMQASRGWPSRHCGVSEIVCAVRRNSLALTHRHSTTRSHRYTYRMLEASRLCEQRPRGCRSFTRSRATFV